MKATRKPMDPVMKLNLHYRMTSFVLDFINFFIISMICLVPFFGIASPIACIICMIVYMFINGFLGLMVALFPNRHILRELFWKFINFCQNCFLELGFMPRGK